MTIILSEFGALEKLEVLKKLYHGKKILLVTGKQSFITCGAKEILNKFLKFESVIKFSDFQTNPKIEDAIRGLQLAIKGKIEMIIAIGGGSVIDMAKLIKAFYRTPNQYREIAIGNLKIKNPNLPFLAIPTTAGSGSEATQFAVVYIDSEKYSVTSPYILPDNIILDSQLIMSGTKYQKACNALDALAQAIESSWAINSTPYSQELSLKSVKLCIKNIKNYVNGSKNSQTLQQMLVASNLAGQAINVSKTTAPHAWSYGITYHYNIPHGHAVWLTLPQIFQCTGVSIFKNSFKIEENNNLKEIFKELMKLLSIKEVEEARNSLNKLLKSIDLDCNMENLGINTPLKRSFISQQINMQRMSNHPTQINKKDVELIFDL